MMLTVFSQIEEWIALITAIVALLAAIGALVPTVIKLGRALKEILSNKQWNELLIAIKDACIEAEKSGKSGAEKKEIVINTVVAFAESIGITVDPDLTNRISEAIDDLITEHNNLTSAKKQAKKALKESK